MWPHLALHVPLWAAAAVLWAAAALAGLHPRTLGARRGELQPRDPEKGGLAWRVALVGGAAGLAWVGARAHFLLARDPALPLELARTLLHGATDGPFGGVPAGARFSRGALLRAALGTLPEGLHIGGGLLLAGAWLALAGRWCLGPNATLASTLDRTLPPAGWAMAVGRLGCLTDGCCFGVAGAWPWCLSYPAGSPPQLNHLARGLIADPHGPSLATHPLPLYLAIGACMASLAAGALRTSPPAGRRAGAFIVVLAGARLVAESFRETAWAPAVPGLAATTASGLVVGVALLAQSLRRSVAEPSPPARPRPPGPKYPSCSSASEP